MSRLHPFDFAFAAMADERFPAIRAACQQANRDPSDRLQFLTLAPVQALLGELGTPASGAVIEEYGTLLYTLYRFWDAGRRSFVLSDAALDRALAPEVVSAPAVPPGACYVQLPERRFWARIGDETPPEPVDGLFLVAGPAGREITVLAVLGLRPDRDGFSQIAVTAPPEDFLRSRDAVRRPLFAPVLEGGERAGVKSLVSQAELLHLAHLALVDVAG